MAYWERNWKKAKPLTLSSKETLTKALRDLDKASEAFAKESTRQNIAAFSGAAKTAGRANAETLKLCNPKLHKQGMAWLTENGKALDRLIAAIAGDQKNFAGFLQEVTRRKDLVVQGLEASASRPGLQVARVSQQQAAEFGTWLNKNSTVVTSKEITFVVQKTTRAKDILAELGKILSKNPVNDVHVAGAVKEIQGVARDLAQPVKFMDAQIKLAESTKPFGQGL